MDIKDLQPRQGNVEVTANVIEVSESREFQKFGKTGKVANAVIEDSSGKVKLTLWNEQIEMVKPGYKVKITNGYVNEYQGDMQLTTGKFGKLEILNADEAAPSEVKEEKQAEKEISEDEKPEELKPEADVEEEDIG